MRTARREPVSSTANRLAAGRRNARRGVGDGDAGARDVESPKRAAKARGSGRTPKGSGKGRAPPMIARAFKLLVLIGAFACIGFFAVLVVDVAASLVGSVKLGDVSVAELVDKVVARVFDDDVPRDQRKPAPPPAPAAPAKKGAKQAAKAPAPADAGARAPVPVGKAEDDAKHVVERADPEVERAKRRLDELLGRL